MKDLLFHVEIYYVFPGRCNRVILKIPFIEQTGSFDSPEQALLTNFEQIKTP